MNMYHACVCKERRLTASSVLPLLLLSRAVATLPHQASPRGRPGTQHRHLLHPHSLPIASAAGAPAAAQSSAAPRRSSAASLASAPSAAPPPQPAASPAALAGLPPPAPTLPPAAAPSHSAPATAPSHSAPAAPLLPSCAPGCAGAGAAGLPPWPARDSQRPALSAASKAWGAVAAGAGANAAASRPPGGAAHAAHACASAHMAAVARARWSAAPSAHVLALPCAHATAAAAASCGAAAATASAPCVIGRPPQVRRSACVTVRMASVSQPCRAWLPQLICAQPGQSPGARDVLQEPQMT